MWPEMRLPIHLVYLFNFLDWFLLFFSCQVCVPGIYFDSVLDTTVWTISQKSNLFTCSTAVLCAGINRDLSGNYSYNPAPAFSWQLLTHRPEIILKYLRLWLLLYNFSTEGSSDEVITKSLSLLWSPILSPPTIDLLLSCRVSQRDCTSPAPPCTYQR